MQKRLFWDALDITLKRGPEKEALCFGTLRLFVGRGCMQVSVLVPDPLVLVDVPSF